MRPARGRSVSLSGPLERGVVRLDAAQTQEITAHPLQEGVLTLFDAQGAVEDRVDFMRWPEGAVLARTETHHTFSYCRDPSPGAVLRSTPHLTLFLPLPPPNKR